MTPPSIQARLLALVLGGVCALWLLAAATAWFDARHELDELLDGHLAQAAALLVVQHANGADEGGAVRAPALHRLAPRVAFQVWQNGRLVVRSDQVSAQPMLPAADQTGSGFHDRDIDGRRWRVFATYDDDRDLRVLVGEQAASRHEILYAVLRGMLMPLVVALPALGAAVWWAVRRGLAPLRRLDRALSERDARALQPLPLADAPAEVRPVVETLNGLFERIAALMDAERRFTADAAHELRTPLAALRAQAQVAMNEADEQVRRRALDHTLQACDRASRLVDQLLTLARLDAGESAPAQPLPLGAAVRSVAAELAPLALARSQRLDLQADEEATVRADPTLLAVLVRNLLDNAIRYGREGGAIDLVVRRHGGAAELEIADDGPGLADAHRARLGERFFRVPGQDAPGSGLGWSIVRRIAAAYGARIEAEPATPAGGLRVRLAWPD